MDQSNRCGESKQLSEVFKGAPEGVRLDTYLGYPKLKVTAESGLPHSQAVSKGAWGKHSYAATCHSRGLSAGNSDR